MAERRATVKGSYGQASRAAGSFQDAAMVTDGMYRGSSGPLFATRAQELERRRIHLAVRERAAEDIEALNRGFPVGLHASALSVAAVLERFLGKGVGRPPEERNGPAAEHPFVVAHDDTNSLVIQAAPRMFEVLTRMAQALDVTRDFEAGEERK